MSISFLYRLLSSRMLCFYLETFHLVEFTKTSFKIVMIPRHDMLLGLRRVSLNNSYWCRAMFKEITL